MSTLFLNETKAAFDRSYSLLEQAIETCPDTLWDKAAGAFPYWTHIMHSYTALEFFIPSHAGRSLEFPFPKEQLELQKTPSVTLTKQQVRVLQQKGLDWANTFFAGMTDAKLLERHEVFSNYTKTECSNMFVLITTAGHALYHLGCCDTLLRENGLKGIM